MTGSRRVLIDSGAERATDFRELVRAFERARQVRHAVWFNDTAEGWRDDNMHSHRESDEIFIVLEGRIILDVAGERVEVGPGEFCCFPEGLRHAVVETIPPLRTFMIRAPSVEDKENHAN